VEPTLEEPCPPGPLTDAWRGYQTARSGGLRAQTLTTLTGFTDDLADQLPPMHDIRQA
jgi:hypothetical protein